MHSLSLNEKLPEEYLLKTSPVGGAAIMFSKDTQLILAGMPQISAAEASAAGRNPIKIGLMKFKDCIFIILDIGGVFVFDCSYNWNVGSIENRGLPPREPKAGFAISFALYDTISEKVRALRFFTVTPKFSEKLEYLVSEQKSRFENGSYDFETSLAKALNKYPDPNAMWKDCLLTEIAGKPFPK